jgi:hypothetical protein
MPGRGESVETLMQRLWGDHYYDPDAGEWYTLLNARIRTGDMR